MAEKIRILVADDDIIVRFFWQNFSNPNYLIKLASDGQQAVDADLKEIDIILLDVNMPGLSGIEAAKIIRQKEKDTENRMPIIGVTAQEGAEVKNACIDAGMDEVLHKPVLANDIDAVITKWKS